MFTNHGLINKPQAWLKVVPYDVVSSTSPTMSQLNIEMDSKINEIHVYPHTFQEIAHKIVEHREKEVTHNKHNE